MAAPTLGEPILGVEADGTISRVPGAIADGPGVEISMALAMAGTEPQLVNGHVVRDVDGTLWLCSRDGSTPEACTEPRLLIGPMDSGMPDPLGAEIVELGRREATDIIWLPDAQIYGIVAAYTSDGRSRAYGSHATVMVDKLNLRYFPGLSGEPAASLPRGVDLFIRSGPVTSAGYQWFEVEALSGIPAGTTRVGWVAAVPADLLPDPPDDAWLVKLGRLACPDPEGVDTVLFASLTRWAIQECGVTVHEVSGLLDTCYEGPMTPFTYEPGWAWFACFYLRDEAGSWSLPVFFPADLDGPMPERGDLATITGQVGVDINRYGECTVTAAEDMPAGTLSAEREVFKSECRTNFVVSSVRITGHVDLPPLV